MDTQERRRWYHEVYLQSDHWQETRAAAIARAGGKCERCGFRAKLEVHHRSYKRLGNERPTDLQVLCAVCHRVHHDTASDWERQTFHRELRERRIKAMQESRRGIMAYVWGTEDYVEDVE